MKLSKMLTIFASGLFVGGVIMIAIGINFCPVALGAPGSFSMLDTFISLAIPALGALLILEALKIVDKIKKARRS